MTTSRLASVALAAAALAAAGCGGHQSRPPAAPAPSATTPSFATDANCRALTQLPQQVATAMTGSAAAGEAPDGALQSLAATAPSEIRSDLAVMASGIRELSAAISDAAADPDTAPDPAAVTRLQRTLADIDQVALTQANQDVGAWVQRYC
jgi:hypothetical protein